MIDIDVALRLRDAGLRWDPVDGDLFAIDTELLRDEPFMLSSMVIEEGLGRHGQRLFRFNGTTEWALDSVEQQDAIWIPREEQLRVALADAFITLQRQDDGAFAVRFRPSGSDEEPRQVRAPNAEDAYAGALLIHLTGD